MEFYTFGSTCADEIRSEVPEDKLEGSRIEIEQDEEKIKERARPSTQFTTRTFSEPFIFHEIRENYDYTIASFWHGAASVFARDRGEIAVVTKTTTVIQEGAVNKQSRGKGSEVVLRGCSNVTQSASSANLRVLIETDIETDSDCIWTQGLADPTENSPQLSVNKEERFGGGKKRRKGPAATISDGSFDHHHSSSSSSPYQGNGDDDEEECFFPPLLLQTTTAATDTPSPIRQPWNGAKVVMIAAGESHMLVLTQQNEIYSAGKGRHGELGVGASVSFCPHLKRIESSESKPKKWVYIAAGCHCSAAIAQETMTRSLYTFGCNSCYRLGLGDDTDRLTPTLVDCLENVGKLKFDGTSSGIAMVACGTWHMVAVACDTNETWGWGWGPFGQLGLRTKAVVPGNTGANSDTEGVLLQQPTLILDLEDAGFIQWEQGLCGRENDDRSSVNLVDNNSFSSCDSKSAIEEDDTRNIPTDDVIESVVCGARFTAFLIHSRVDQVSPGFFKDRYSHSNDRRYGMSTQTQVRTDSDVDLSGREVEAITGSGPSNVLEHHSFKVIVMGQLGISFHFDRGVRSSVLRTAREVWRTTGRMAGGTVNEESVSEGNAMYRVLGLRLPSVALHAHLWSLTITVKETK